MIQGAEFVDDSVSVTYARTLDGHTGSVTGVCALADYVITSSTDATIKFWRQSDGSLATSLDTKNEIHSLAHARISHRQYLLLIGCCQGDVELFRGTLGQPVKMKLVGRFSFHAPNPVTTLVVSRDLRYLASGTCFQTYLLEYRKLTQSTRGGVKLWNLADILENANDDVTGCSGQPIARSVCTAHKLGAEAARILLASGSTLDRHVEDFGVRSAAFTPDGSVLIVGFGFDDNSTSVWSKTLVFCSSENLKVLHVYNGLTTQIRHLVAIPSNQRNAEVQEDSDDVTVFVQTTTSLIKLRQINSQSRSDRFKIRVEWTYAEHSKNQICCGIALSPDNVILLSAHASADVSRLPERYTDAKLVFHDATSGRVLSSCDPGFSGLTSAVCYSADGSALYAAAGDHTIRCFRSSRVPVTCSRGAPNRCERGKGSRETASHHVTGERPSDKSSRRKYLAGEQSNWTSPEIHQLNSASKCCHLFSAPKRQSSKSREDKDLL